MKSCDGCRWIYEDTFVGSNEKLSFCRAMPPQVQSEKVDDQIAVHSNYPLVPRIRCGLYQRRWFTRTPKA